LHLLLLCDLNPFGVTLMRAFLIASLVLCAAPALADETEGTVLAFDRVANVLVLDDKTVWSLGAKTEVSPDLMAGDVVKIIYVGGGDAGIGPITSVLKQP
jgi:hypothetical protein